MPRRGRTRRVSNDDDSDERRVAASGKNEVTPPPVDAMESVTDEPQQSGDVDEADRLRHPSGQ